MDCSYLRTPPVLPQDQRWKAISMHLRHVQWCACGHALLSCELQESVSCNSCSCDRASWGRHDGVSLHSRHSKNGHVVGFPASRSVQCNARTWRPCIQTRSSSSRHRIGLPKLLLRHRSRCQRFTRPDFRCPTRIWRRTQSESCCCQLSSKNNHGWCRAWVQGAVLNVWQVSDHACVSDWSVSFCLLSLEPLW